MEGTIKDIQYLETMERLEQPDNQGLEESFHIVPISGLVVSKLVRFESEVCLFSLSASFRRSLIHCKCGQSKKPVHIFAE